MPNTICHFEIGGPSLEKSREFYEKIFDWKFEAQGPSISIQTGDAIGGHLNSLGHEPHTYVTVYVSVDDVKASLDAAVAAGGKALVGPVDIGIGIFGWISDPDGNIIGLWKDKAPA